MTTDRSTSEVHAVVTGFLSETIPGFRFNSDLDPEISLTSSGMIDSIQFIELILYLEAHFQVELDFGNEDPRAFTTVSGLAKAIKRSQGYSKTPS